MEKLDAVVIGAGVVGLAVARALAMAGREVVILESEPRFGTRVHHQFAEATNAQVDQGDDWRGDEPGGEGCLILDSGPIIRFGHRVRAPAILLP